METIVPVSNGELWADDSGGHGLPLILLHPGVGDSTIWDLVLPALTARHRVIRYDSRGYGRSPGPAAVYSLVEDLAEVLDHFELARAVLVGSSMGGATSISLALHSPDRVAGLALFAPGATGYDSAPPGFYEEVGKLATADDIEGIVRLVLGIWGRAGGGTPEADPVAAAQLRGVLPAWFSTVGHQRTDAPAFHRLGEIAAPALLALGELDEPEVVRCNEEMADRIPDCRLVRLAACDHYPTLREPETVVQLIEQLYADAR
ncbi:alpha/beta fold hydrolase [Streptomyces luteolifulvus]|uniref:Alpha/beta fold hydrolase n=1 Tax=Streptomyces luteolifulvus TaxID=2615112 RepID=A0A6H9UQE9_9ACTN|nr:alpha/beta fold hydrolase [Streptomyces luteolifulvus]KAB1140023.1 alpha/beta fold hydrolase [Streptomyces luteolifulvus]